MTKFNKNLYKYAIGDNSSRAYGSFMSFLKYAAYVYMLGTVLLSGIGLMRLYVHFVNMANSDDLLFGFIWLCVIFVLGGVAVFFSIKEKTFIEAPFALIAAIVNIIIASPVGILNSEENTTYLYKHLLPSLIVIFVVLCCLTVEIIKANKNLKEYNRYYNALYRWACDKQEKVLTTDEFNEVLDNYKGTPIKKEYFDKR